MFSLGDPERESQLMNTTKTQAYVSPVTEHKVDAINFQPDVKLQSSVVTDHNKMKMMFQHIINIFHFSFTL